MVGNPYLSNSPTSDIVLGFTARQSAIGLLPLQPAAISLNASKITFGPVMVVTSADICSSLKSIAPEGCVPRSTFWLGIHSERQANPLCCPEKDVAMDSLIVLCIDDRPHVLELRKAVLATHDFSVETALSGYTAMNLLERMLVDAVLLEYKQEGMDAEAIAYQIKQRFPNLPIILLSAYVDMPERVLWFVDEYVMKSELPEASGVTQKRPMRVTSKPANGNEARGR